MDYSKQIFAFLVAKEVNKRVVGELGRGEATEDQLNERLAYHLRSVVEGVKGTMDMIQEIEDHG